MKKYLIVCFVLLTIISACGPAETPVQEPETAQPSEDAADNVPAEAAEPKMTNITIDGNPDDWSDREVLLDDDIGDSDDGYLDMTSGYAFVNDHALYFMVMFDDPGAEGGQFDIEVEADSAPYLISWTDGHESGFIGDLSKDNEPVGDTKFSSFAFDTVLEGRIPFEEFSDPGSFNLVLIGMWVGECCDFPEWHPADEWSPPTTPTVNEYESPREVSDELKYVLARRFQLPEGYVAEPIYSPPVPGLAAIARSQDGTIFLAQTGLYSGVTVLDIESGEATRILELPSGLSLYNTLVPGPDDSVFIPTWEEILQVFSDGSYEVWGKVDAAWPHLFTEGSRMLGRSMDETEVVELFPDGSSEPIAGGFTRVYDIKADENGTLFVSDAMTGNITRVEQDGTQRNLAEGLIFSEPVEIDFDLEGNLYFKVANNLFTKINTENGAQTEILVNTPCTTNASSFVFSGPNQMLILDPTDSQVTWTDTSSGDNRLLVSSRGSNSPAAIIGPDDVLYAGVAGCGTEDPSKVIRVSDDGTEGVIVDGLVGKIHDIAFSSDGGLYISVEDQIGGSWKVIYKEKDSEELVEIPGLTKLISLAVDPVSGNVFGTRFLDQTLFEFNIEGLVAEYEIQTPKDVWDFYIDFTTDGKLIGYITEAENHEGPVVERWLLEINPEDGTTDSLLQYDREGCCPMGNVDVAQDGTMWWVIDPEFYILQVSSDGEYVLYAQDLPIDAAAVVADSEGDVYFTSSSGIYRIYLEE